MIKLPNKAVQESSTSIVQQAAGEVHSGDEVSLTLCSLVDAALFEVMISYSRNQSRNIMIFDIMFIKNSIDNNLLWSTFIAEQNTEDSSAGLILAKSISVGECFLTILLKYFPIDLLSFKYLTTRFSPQIRYKISFWRSSLILKIKFHVICRKSS